MHRIFDKRSGEIFELKNRRNHNYFKFIVPSEKSRIPCIKRSETSFKTTCFVKNAHSDNCNLSSLLLTRTVPAAMAVPKVAQAERR